METGNCKLGERRIVHFRKRLMERFGLIVSDMEIGSIISDIFNSLNRPILILADTGNSFHKFNIQGSDVLVLFDWETNVPLTAYRTGWIRHDELGNYDFYYNKRAKDIRILNRSETFTQKTGIKNNRVCSIS